jgi:hypothetical protein
VSDSEEAALANGMGAVRLSSVIITFLIPQQKTDITLVMPVSIVAQPNYRAGERFLETNLPRIAPVTDNIKARRNQRGASSNTGV